MVFTQMSARELSQAIHRRTLSCREVMQACLAQISRHNPQHLAIVSLQDTDDLLRQADERDAMLARLSTTTTLRDIESGHAVACWKAPVEAQGDAVAPPQQELADVRP